MEFIKDNTLGFPVLGRYKYVFFSDSTKHFYFNTPGSTAS